MKRQNQRETENENIKLELEHQRFASLPRSSNVDNFILFECEVG